MKVVTNNYGRVRGGEIIWELPELYRQDLLSLEGCEVVVNIKRVHKKPSTSSYNYYRGIILVDCYRAEFFKAMNNKDEIHEFYFAPKFLGYKKIIEVGGIKREVTKVESLADISQERMNEFVERVKGECHELNITIRPPELGYNKFYKE